MSPHDDRRDDAAPPGQPEPTGHAAPPEVPPHVPVSNEHFVAELKDSLHRAALTQIERNEARARRRRVGTWVGQGAAAAAAIATALWVTLAGGGGTVAADLEVLHRDGHLVMTLEDIRTRSDEIEQAARDAGIDLTVIEEPVGPANVGRFLSLTSDGPLPPNIVPASEVGGVFVGFKVPEDYDAALVLRRGRLAEPGELWATDSNSFAKDEPLECDDVEGMTASQFEQLAQERDLTVRWTFEGPDGHAESDAPDGHEDWQVVQVTNTSPTALRVVLTPDGAWPFPPGVPEQQLRGDC